MNPRVLKPVIFYFHGFGSHANSRKVKILKEHFKSNNTKFVAVSYNTYDPDKAYNTLKEVVERNISKGYEPIFVGTSLGGYWAKMFASDYSGYMVGANPSFYPKTSLVKYLKPNNVFTDFMGNDHEFTKKMVDKYNTYYDRNYLLSAGVTLLLCANDEILGDTWDNVIKNHPKAKVKILDTGTHRFEDMDALISEIGIFENRIKG